MGRIRKRYSFFMLLVTLGCICSQPRTADGQSGGPSPAGQGAAASDGLLAQGDPSGWQSPPAGGMSPSLEDLLAGSKPDKVIEIPQLPDLQGWYTHLGTDGHATRVFAGEQLVIITETDRLRAFDRRSGEYRWSYDGHGADWYNGFYIVGNQYVACGTTFNYTYIVNAADGQELLGMQNRELLSLGPDGAWLIAESVDTAYDGPVYDLIQRIDPGSGAVLEQHELPGIVAGCAAHEFGSGPLAIVTNDALYSFDTEQGLRRIADARADCEHDMAVSGKLLAMLSFESLIYDPDAPAGEEYQREGEPLLRVFDLHSGTLLWQQELPGFFNWDDEQLQMNDRMLALNHRPGLTLFDVHSGELLYDYDGNEQSVNSNWLELAENGVYWTAGDYRSSTLQRFDYATREIGPLPEFADLDLQGCTVSGNQMFLLLETVPSGHDFYDANSHLLGLQLDAAGLPQPGELSMNSRQEDYSPLLDGFMAAADPSVDKDLMSGLSKAGINALRPLLQHCPEMSPVQLDSLALLADALSPRHDSEWMIPEYQALDALTEYILKQPDQRYVPALIRWQASARLERLHRAGPGLLAACGGARAKAWLDAYYAGLMDKPYAPPAPPYELQPENRPYGDIWQPDGASPLLWQASATLPDGSAYLAYCGEGLLSGRDIFPAIDTDGDGAYEEVLPTGLAHTYFYMTHPGGPVRVDPDWDNENPGPSRAITLSVDAAAGSVAIGHYNPINEMVPYDNTEYGGDKGEYRRMTGADWAQDTLALDDLRRDADGDGLTDIAENMLQTDPANPDCDADGLPDGLDPQPLANPANMGANERAAMRALAFFTDYSGGFATWWSSRDPAQPWNARYIETDDSLGPLAYSGSQATLCITLTDENMQHRYAEMLNGYNDFASLNVSMQAVPHYVDSAGEPIEDYFPPSTVMLIDINMALQGQYITLAEIDGEYYPISIVDTWIS